MREEGSNDVTIFGSSRYLYVGAGPVVGQMRVSQLQYFLIFFQNVCRDFPSINTLARPQLPQSGRPSKFFSPNRDIAIGIYEHCGIAYLERLTVFSDTVTSVEMAPAEAVGEIWQYVRTSFGVDILPNERPCIYLDNIIITIIIVVVVVVVTDFSDSEHRPRRFVFRRIGRYGDRFRLRPDFEMSRWRRRRRRRLFFFFFFATVSLPGDAGSGKTFCRKSAFAFIRVLRVISNSPLFLRNLPHLSYCVAFRVFAYS